MTWAKMLACLVVMAFFGGIVFTQEAGKDKAPEGKDGKSSTETKLATYKVEKKPFKIELTVKGILEAEETAEISYRPHPMVQQPPSHGPVTICKIADHGAKVKKGDLLAAFDTSKIDEVIEELERDKKGLEANLKLAEEELPVFEKSVPADVAAAERAKTQADEELKYFLDVARAEFEKAVNMHVKFAKFYMEYAEEELRQLEKMYKANDLTEDTEKIILRRQREYLEMAKYFYQSALIERDYVLKFGLPNKEKALKENQVRQDLQLEKARKTLEPTAIQKRAALAKMRFDLEKNGVRLEKLLKDRDALTIRSPIDGVVYHGKFHKGQWSTSDRLLPHGTVSPDEVFLTVVKPRPVVVHLIVEEKDAHLIKLGQQGKARMLVNPDRKLSARVTKLSAVPAAPGKFDALVALDIGAEDANLMPGMACSVKFVPYSKKEALVVPSKSIHEEEDKYVVDVVGKSGKHEQRQVTPGRSDGEHTEILQGLREGEEILVERPGQKSLDTSPMPEKEKEKEKEKGAIP